MASRQLQKSSFARAADPSSVARPLCSVRPRMARWQPSQPQLPPIEPLSRPARGSALVGVLVLGALPDGVSSQVVQGLRAVLKLAPSVKDAVVLDAPQPCTNEACWILAGAAANVDQV